MSNLILPDGVESPEDSELENVPEDIADSFNLLLFGLQHNTILMLAKTMNDNGGQKVYDLAVGVPHPITGELRMFPVARMMPQHKKQAPNDEPNFPAVPKPDPVA